jgi:hypothetical protein
MVKDTGKTSTVVLPLPAKALPVPSTSDAHAIAANIIRFIAPPFR